MSASTREPRRLLSVIHGPVFGGGFNQMVQLCGPLRERGWETIAVAPAEEGNAAQRLREAGMDMYEIELHRLRAVADPRPHLRLLRTMPREVGRLRGLIRARGIDVVQAHGDTNPHVALAAHLEGVAVVWEIYDTRTPVPLRQITMPAVTRIADVITTWGNDLARVHPGVLGLGERHVVVFPPVDARRFRPDPQRRAKARVELGVDADAFLLGAVGNLNPSKGYEWLISAVARAHASDPRLTGRVIGARSPVHAAYEEGLRRQVSELGLADAFGFADGGTRVSELMPGLDALVISSVGRSEGIPTVILEAMACGLPVIATDVGALAEVIEQEVTGVVVPPEDADALAAAILRVAGDPQFAERMGVTARERVAERYDLGRCADAHSHSYELAVEHRARRDGSGA